jgi:molybdenum cofactor cytidylyltransferase
MRYGLRPLAGAEGAILGHGMAGLKKGHRLAAADIRHLEAQGITAAMIAQMEDGDIHEDEAARRIAEALAGDGTRATPPHTGRCNLHAGKAGLVRLDSAAIDRINRVHESITVATLKPMERVDAGQMIATVKIIPFASPDWAVASAVEIARTARIQLSALSARRVALISTSTPGFKESLHDKTRDVIERRLATLGSQLVEEQRVSHAPDAIASAIAATDAIRPDIVLVMGASATTDRADTVPSAIEAAGGEVLQLGMPVDPGNLLVLAERSGIPIIGVPGCARSPKLNGLDFVLQRLCAGIPVTPASIQSMGVGGLLQEIASRPQLRELQESRTQRKRITAILLAAGRSTRMKGPNKLLLPLAGRPLVVHAARALAQSRADSIVVVTGHDRAGIEAALADEHVSFIHNTQHETGMASSLKAGLGLVPADADGILVCLGDMPAVSSTDIDSILDAFDPASGRSIVVPVFAGKRGNPVLLARQFFTQVMACTGDTGARQVLADNADAVFEVEMPTASVLADADTPAAFAALKAERDRT